MTAAVLEPSTEILRPRGRLWRTPIPAPRASSRWTPAPTPDFGLAFLVDDGARLKSTGYRLHVEADRGCYLLRVWYGLCFREALTRYADGLEGDVRDVLFWAFQVRCWADFGDGSGSWGSGNRLVFQDSVRPLEEAGRLVHWEA